MPTDIPSQALRMLFVCLQSRFLQGDAQCLMFALEGLKCLLGEETGVTLATIADEYAWHCAYWQKERAAGRYAPHERTLAL
jgi:hypothetical protein